MTQEEKAKRYDEALERYKAKQEYEYQKVHEFIEYLFPELKESEGERIRKSLSVYFAKFKPDDMWDADFSFGDIVAWFEKQGEQILANSAKTCKDEQKPAWSEEDHKNMETLINVLYAGTDLAYEREINWLKSLKGRVLPQQQQEWSEEDEKKRKCLIKGLEDRMGFGWASDPFSREEYINWLKSIRPRNRWKPSIAQLNALSIVSKGYTTDDIEAIVSLYQDLKKLREE